MPIFSSGYSSKTTPVDNDKALIADSEASNAIKSVTFANLFNYIKTKLQAATSWISTAMITDAQVTSRKLSLTTYDGTMAQVSLTATPQTVATVSLPSTSTPRKYLVNASFQANHQANAAVTDYISGIYLDGTLIRRTQYTNMPNQYTFSMPATAIITSSGGSLTFVMYRSSGSGGQSLSNSHYTVVDIGAA